MRRRTLSALLPALVGLVLALAGCGSGEEARPLPETIAGEVPQETGVTETDPGTETDEVPEPTEEGDPEAGAQVFASAGCGACHTLEDAGTSGQVGPNLDEAAPSYEVALETITNGRGAMPAFAGQLSEEEIQNVAAYVVQATGG